MKNIRLNEFIELITDGEAIVAGYEFSRSQVEKEIWNEMKECFRRNDILENHLKDFIAMVCKCQHKNVKKFRNENVVF